MSDPLAFGNLSADTSAPRIAAFDQRMAHASALAALTVIVAAIAYSRESGFIVYGILFAIPYAVFGLARNTRKWQAWGWALAWVTIALALVATLFTARRVMHHVHGSDIATLVVLAALLLTQAAQLAFVRRAFSGTIAFGRPLFRSVLYYLCLSLVVAATLPNWYVPPVVRRENEAVSNLRKYFTAMESYAKTSEAASYPPVLSTLFAPGERASWSLDSELVCDVACIKNGYHFEYRPMFNQQRVSSYTISARPLEFEETGTHSFLLTADGKIHQTREDREALITDSNR
jgi:hypothetical protein